MSVEALTADGFKIVIATASGPASAVSVGAGAVADVDLTVAPNPAVVREILGLRTITGLPSGIVLVGVSYPSVNTVRIRVYNATATAITIAAGSVSATVLAKAS